MSNSQSFQPGAALADLRKRRPLVQCITNFVAMQTTANVLLATGASPAMTMDIAEAAEFSQIADALNINIGTLTTTQVKTMVSAIEAVQDSGKPWALDPVGAGASAMRTGTSQHLAAMRPTIIRGNSSEILAQAGLYTSSKGVDSANCVEDAEAAAEMLVDQTGAVVCVTGQADIVLAPGGRRAVVSNGDAMMQKVTAIGCSLTALTAAFAACQQDAFEAAVSTLAFYGVAGEFAVGKANGPGSFSVQLLDALHNITPEDVNKHAKVDL